MRDCTKNDILVVTTTVGSMEDAHRMARGLVERELAACVQLDAIAASYYKWEGKVCKEPEVRLTIKSVALRLQDIEAYFDEHHPYDLPQFVYDIRETRGDYGMWVYSNIGLEF